MDTANEKTLLATATTERHVKLEVTDVSADTVTVHFTGLPNNDPNKYSNYSAIWQGPGAGYDGRAPKGTFAFGPDYHDPVGEFTFDKLTITTDDYTVGYAVGAEQDTGQKYGNVCATAYIPSGASDPKDCTYQSLILEMGRVGSTSVSVKFSAPDNYNAKLDGAWIGIWRDQASYFTVPAKAAKADIDGSSGTVTINGFPLGVGNKYTIAMFATGWNEDPSKRPKTTMAATVTFTVGQ